MTRTRAKSTWIRTPTPTNRSSTGEHGPRDAGEVGRGSDRASWSPKARGPRPRGWSRRRIAASWSPTSRSRPGRRPARLGSTPARLIGVGERGPTNVVRKLSAAPPAIAPAAVFTCHVSSRRCATSQHGRSPRARHGQRRGRSGRGLHRRGCSTRSKDGAATSTGGRSRTSSRTWRSWTR